MGLIFKRTAAWPLIASSVCLSFSAGAAAPGEDASLPTIPLAADAAPPDPPAAAASGVPPIETVIVTGELLDRPAERTTSSVAVKSGAEIERSTARDVYDVIMGLLDYPQTEAHPGFTLSLQTNFADGGGGDTYFRFVGSEGVINVSFTSLDFARSDAVRFRYRLSGMEFDWSETGSHWLHYPAIAPGDYRFELQAIDPDQQRHSPIISLRFTVRPPWWRTRAMYLLLGIASFVASILVWHWRENRLLARQRMLRKLVAQRTRELEAEKAELRELLAARARPPVAST